jgi:DNA-binding XRE family transcriptional regulator
MIVPVLQAGSLVAMTSLGDVKRIRSPWWISFGGVLVDTYTYILYPYTYRMSRKNTQSKPVSVDWKAVGRRIRELRGFDMTQADLAHRIGVSQGYLSTVERGQGEIGAEVLLTISQQFEKSLEWLLTGEE